MCDLPRARPALPGSSLLLCSNNFVLQEHAYDILVVVTEGIRRKRRPEGGSLAKAVPCLGYPPHPPMHCPEVVERDRGEMLQAMCGCLYGDPLARLGDRLDRLVGKAVGDGQIAFEAQSGGDRIRWHELKTLPRVSGGHVDVPAVVVDRAQLETGKCLHPTIALAREVLPRPVECLDRRVPLTAKAQCLTVKEAQPSVLPDRLVGQLLEPSVDQCQPTLGREVLAISGQEPCRLPLEPGFEVV